MTILSQISNVELTAYYSILNGRYILQRVLHKSEQEDRSTAT